MPGTRTHFVWLFWGAGIVLFALGLQVVAAQSPGLPTAPVPRILLAQLDHTAGNPSHPDSPAWRPDAADAAGTGHPAGDVEASPVVTMVPHPEDSLYWISGQANIIFQGRLPFHSPYQGTNSFRNSAEYKTSLVGTLYTALRPTHSVRYSTDFIFDMESAGGRGLSQALGLAGFTNLDVVRNPNLGSTPYIARYEIHQVIGLTDKTTSQEGNFFSLA